MISAIHEHGVETVESGWSPAGMGDYNVPPHLVRDSRTGQQRIFNRKREETGDIRRLA